MYSTTDFQGNISCTKCRLRIINLGFFEVSSSLGASFLDTITPGLFTDLCQYYSLL